MHSTKVPAQTTAPDGFRIVGKRGDIVRVTKQIVQQINIEVGGTNREEHIQHYIGMLSSRDATNRMFATYALGNFQSPKSLAALFAQAKKEKNPQAICQLANSVCELFPYWPGADQGFGAEKWDCLAVLKQWARYYDRHGYLGIFEAEYKKVRGNLEAEVMFISGFATDTPSPDLLSFYQSVLNETSFPKIKNACQEAIDKLSKRK